MVEARAVFDVRKSGPTPSDKFFVDTNVWYKFTYSIASISSNENIEVYSSFIEQCVRVKCGLFYSPLTFTELAHNIEKDQLERYNAIHAPHLDAKAFRQLNQERKDVVAEVKDSWGQVQRLAQHYDTPTDAAALIRCIKLFELHMVDGYDVFFADIVKRDVDMKLLTDDADFLHIPDLTIFTANNKALKLARQAGVLKT